MLTAKQEQTKAAMKPIICTWLKRYRKGYHMTQEEMARMFMMSVRSYIDLEHGESLPSALTLSLFLIRLEKEEQKELLNDLRREIAVLMRLTVNSIAVLSQRRKRARGAAKHTTSKMVPKRLFRFLLGVKMAKSSMELESMYMILM